MTTEHDNHSAPVNSAGLFLEPTEAPESLTPAEPTEAPAPVEISEPAETSVPAETATAPAEPIEALRSTAHSNVHSSVQTAEATFADFAINTDIVDALADAGIRSPFPIQAMTLPVALAGHDIIGQAKTGTGKTLGFGIPLLNRVIAAHDDAYGTLKTPGLPQAIVIVPTRELAVQVAGDLSMASKQRKIRIVQLYGGRAYEPQVNALKTGADVIVGTPGRMIDLLKQKILNLSQVTCVVLDEADEMLDLGFLPDVERLLSSTPPVRHTMLFSATMPGPVVAMARRYMRQPTHIRASSGDDDGQTVENIKQVVYRTHALDKIEVLARALQAEDRGLSIVFARTKRTADKVALELADRGFAAAAIHGDLGQGAREQALRAFRSGKIDVLVATDVAARGIDVEDVTHVFNYQCPEDERTYLHRTGRTGRAGSEGTAVTFVDWDDLPRWSLIDKALDLGIPVPVETYSTSEHLFTDLDIPKGTKGQLPRTARTRAGLDAENLEDLGETGKRVTRGADRGGSGRSGGSGRGDSGRGDSARAGSGRGGQNRGGSGRNAGEGRGGSGTRTSSASGSAAASTADGTPRPKRQRQRRRKSTPSAE